MKTPFYVRICVNHDFAKSQKDQNIYPVAQLVKKLGGYVKEDCISCYITWGVIKVEDSDIKSVKEKMNKTWADLFPQNQNALNLFIIEVVPTDACEVLKIMYSAYFGWESYLDLCTDVYKFIPKFRAMNAMDYFYQQNYLVSIDKGCGFTTMISSFSDYFEKLKVFDNSKSYYTEYKMGKETANGEVCVDDLISNLNNEENYYQVLGIDICYYLDDKKYDEFRAFLNRLDPHQKNYIFMFRVPYLESKALKKVEALISDVVAIKEIIIKPYNEAIYDECLMNEMWGRNLSIGDNLFDVFHKRIIEEKNDGRFYGFKTIYKIINEILWLKVADDVQIEMENGKPQPKTITGKNVANLAGQDYSDEIDGYEELSQMIGMEKVTKKIKEIVAGVKVAMANNTLEKPCLHMRFVGSPGTGKTTVARIVGKIFKKEGILRNGLFFEHMARDLCGEFIGQTSPRTSAICRDAYGSVLFIDEAYSLYSGDYASSNDYGKEALATLIAEMENHRDDMVVIMAGYTDDMEILMKGNSGLRSRMPFILEFDNYTKSQLFDIFMSMVKKHFSYTPDFEKAVKDFFDNIDDAFLNSKEFANARFARNLYERTWSKAALRATFSDSSKLELTKEDFEFASSEKEFSEKLEVTRRLGF